MSGHTPGLWSVDLDLACIRNGDGVPVIGGGAFLAVGHQEAWANLRIAAAAPELLEALQWYVQNDDTNVGQEGNEFYEAGLSRAEAAIAKATGGQP